MTPAATTPAHPSPPSEPATTTRPEQQRPPPPPPPPSGVESEAPPKRRKVEEVGFQRSPYYTIRETVVNLRGRFLQVCQETDSQQKDAAVEILKEMKDVMELSKKTRLDLSSTAEPVKPFEKTEARAPEDIPAGKVPSTEKSRVPPTSLAAEPVKPFDRPEARAPEYIPAGKVPSTEKSQVPPTSLAGNFVHSTVVDIPLKPANSDTAAHRLLVETKEGARPSDLLTPEHGKGYHRAVEDEYEDEYYDQDEYEEDGSGAGDEYVEEEEPSEGQKEILELRERLKEQIRRKAKAAAASAAGRSSSFHDRIPPTSDNKFGSFFGPSKPVISRRVIEERKSLKELHSTISRDPRPSARDMPSSSKVQNKVTNGHHPKPKMVNEVKRKAEALKDNRDYSFLLSDDADLSSSPKEKTGARSSLSQRADREVMHSAAKSKAPTSQPAGRLSNGYGCRNTLSTQRHAEGMPSRPISSNGIRDDHAKRKQVVKRRFDEDEDEEDPLAMIRNMFGYDPRKYQGRDDDDSDMEADFATIEREEKRSARIARQEDEEQLRLIEEEERREQERKRRKMARGR
nr:unnamed protein product [Digitaria exilis]